MIFPIIPLYTVTDFLMDQKEDIKRWEKLKKRAKTPERKVEIESQKSYMYKQGLEALELYKQQVPESVRAYYLSDIPKPTVDKIMSELREIHNPPLNYRKIAYWIVIPLLVALTILAIIY